MFEERYKALSSAEKKLFTSYVDELLFDSFIVRKKYDRVTGVSKISPTYLFIEKYFDNFGFSLSFLINSISKPLFS